MPARQTIRFGEAEHSLDVPRGMLVGRLEPASVAPRAPAAEIIRRALALPLGSAPLREFARGKRSAAILVPGKDRVAAASVCLPLLLDELNAAGIPDEAVEVFLATGTHAKHSVEDLARLLGAEAAGRVRCREHDCNDEHELRRIGTTSYGTEVLLHKSVLDADVKVLTGRIIPHYFAGFGGGRKALVPGVAGFRTICQNHRLTLDPVRGIHARVRPCSLSGNPVHLDMLEAARLVGPVFVLNTILDTGHKVVSAYAGELEAAHEAGCAEAERAFKVELPEPVDALITSAGGSPYDCNFMQALKAIFDVQEAVRPGGAILWVAQCPDGMKPGFLRWAEVDSDEELERAVRADYDLTGHNSIMLRALRRRARVAFWSGLPDEHVRALGLEPLHSLREGADWLCDELPKRFRYAVAPWGNVTYAALR
jgi:nickel-dependent lactate racemase